MGKGDTKAGGFLAPKVSGQQSAAAHSAPASSPGSGQWGEQSRPAAALCIAIGAVVLLPWRGRLGDDEARLPCAGNCQQNQGQGTDETAVVLPALRKGLPVLIAGSRQRY